jgi:hypothetical protein
MTLARFAALAGVASLVAAACSGTESMTEPNVLNLNVVKPAGWFVISSTIPTYAVGLDHVTIHDGQAALAIAGTDPSARAFAGVSQFVKADTYRGKRLRLRAWVRQQATVGSDIGLWMRVDGPGVTQGFDNFSSRPLLGTSDWHQVEVILDVPDDAIGIGFGALMSGKGELFVDDMTFDVIPADGPTTNQLAGFETAGVDSATTVAQYSSAPAAPANLNFETP